MESLIKAKQTARDDINAKISEYLLKGGKIELCKPPMDLRHDTTPVGESHLSVEV